MQQLTHTDTTVHHLLIKYLVNIHPAGKLTMCSMLDNPETTHLDCMHHFRLVVST